jgi:hypothetical protein
MQTILAAALALHPLSLNDGSSRRADSFCGGDDLVLAAGPRQGTPGVFQTPVPLSM